MLDKPLSIGSKTAWGEIQGIACNGFGERYYFMVDEHNTVSLMPADVVESDDAAQRGGAGKLGQEARFKEPLP